MIGLGHDAAVRLACPSEYDAEYLADFLTAWDVDVEVESVEAELLWE